MSLHRINRVRVLKYLYNAKSGEMDRYAKINEWYKLTNYYGIRYIKYRVTTGDYGVIVSSPINRSCILQEGWSFEFSK